MFFSESDVTEFIEDNDVKFIRLTKQNGTAIVLDAGTPLRSRQRGLHIFLLYSNFCNL